MSLQGPSLKPPPGVTPNFVDPYDLRDVDKAIMAVCLVVPAVAIGLRLYYTVFVRKNSGADDWTLLLGFVVYIAYSACMVVTVDHGLARHQWNVRLVDFEVILYYTRVTSCLYCVFVPLIRTSILLQLLKLFNPPNKRGFMFWSCWSLITFVVLIYTAGLFPLIFICNPIRQWWTVTMTDGHCLDYQALIPVAGIVNVITDAAMIALPQKSIWSLQMPVKQKLKVCAVFLVAFFALAASVMRLYYSFMTVISEDRIWYGNLMSLWAFAEFVTMVLCSCTPTLVGLFKHWSLKFASSGEKRSSSTTVLRTSLGPELGDIDEKALTALCSDEFSKLSVRFDQGSLSSTSHVAASNEASTRPVHQPDHEGDSVGKAEV